MSVLKSFITKKGRRAAIRQLVKSDLPELFLHANKLIDEDTFIMLSGKHITYEEEKKYLEGTLKKIALGKNIHLVVEVDGRFAGSFEVRVLDKRSAHVGEIGISIAQDYREEGVGFICLQTLIDQARELGLKLLYLHCFTDNVRAIRLYEKCGFIKSGVIPGKYFYKGKYEDEITMYLPLNKVT